ncbi:origin recognition complex subunit 5-like [Pecten maximus]|uniref:origin recognition complex subunit 5-like n=1 Tax=Pecten maximus TaxID=6579 RepID=UPI0014587E8A|nr:origin recognition complex subunit 5-like [Pecten maximus]
MTTVEIEEVDPVTNMSGKISCRDRQIRTLVSLIGKREQVAPPALFIYGHTGTGKSLVINSLVQTLELPHVTVNCVECYNQRFMYEKILNKLQGLRSYMADPDSYLKCDNMNDFIRMFRQVCEDQGLNKQTVYIVLDKAECLRDKEVNILPTFLRLQELTHQNVCVILMTEIVWEKFRTGTGYCEPYIVNFPDYTKDEVLTILTEDRPDGSEADFYSMYLNLLLSVFHMVCRDLREIRYLAGLNYEKYCQPIRTGEAEASDTRKLWKNIEPHLKKALQTVYLREVSSSQWEKAQQETEVGQMPSLQGLSSRNHVELPYYSKYLLIAAYLASYNPAKTDRRFFARNSGKVDKRAKFIKKHERTSNHMLGPKQFPIDRLMAIFFSIVEGKVSPTANIFVQISSLVSLNMLGQVAGDDQIDTPKYKCLVSLEFIKSVSRTVGFDVLRYLYDFV